MKKALILALALAAPLYACDDTDIVDYINHQENTVHRCMEILKDPHAPIEHKTIAWAYILKHVYSSKKGS